MELVLAGQLLGAIGMLGVIWVVQLVHYPLFRHVPADAFVAMEAAHTRRISFVVGPLMALEGATTLILLARPPTGAPSWLPWAGAACAAVALGVTALVSAPLHGRLSAGRDDVLLERLIRTNWARTAAWTGHGLVAVALALAA